MLAFDREKLTLTQTEAELSTLYSFSNITYQVYIALLVNHLFTGDALEVVIVATSIVTCMHACLSIKHSKVGGGLNRLFFVYYYSFSSFCMALTLHACMHVIVCTAERAKLDLKIAQYYEFNMIS